jgi:hypothetical protein
VFLILSNSRNASIGFTVSEADKIKKPCFFTCKLSRKKRASELFQKPFYFQVGNLYLSTEINSTSKTNIEFGGITPPAPLAP